MLKSLDHIIPISLDGPYHKETFQRIWLKHFQPNATPLEFDGFQGVSFFKKGSLPLYANVGATNTKSVVYRVDSQYNPNKSDKNVFLVYDVPDYLPFDSQNHVGLQLKSIPQYEGFFCNLTHADTVDTYLNTAISKRSRAKLRNYENRLNKENVN